MPREIVRGDRKSAWRFGADIAQRAAYADLSGLVLKCRSVGDMSDALAGELCLIAGARVEFHVEFSLRGRDYHSVMTYSWR